ncbi:AraC family transcriptional regulator [Terasakiella pusilla]|uniref:AraC family transcriptional regulator n=1 Tax=Terasakiella pusilla TaxID=64973 RepID=UPI003AA8C32F
MEYLSSFNVFKSSDPDTIETVIASYTSPFKMGISRKSTGFNANLNMTKVHKLDFAHSTFGDPEIEWSSKGESDNSYIFFIPTSGGGEVTHQKQNWEFSSSTGVVWDMAHDISASQQSFHSFSLTLSKEKLAAHASALGGPQCGMTGVMLDPMVNLASPAGMLFKNTIKSVADALDGPAGNTINDLVLSQYSDLILTQILTQFSPIVRRELNGPVSSYILPKNIKLARDYIHSHISEKLDMMILSQVSNCSYRTLQRGFMSAFNLTPIQYIRKVRLQFVKNEINLAGPEITISAIARKWGFGHLGRFANEFHKEFGYHPREHRKRTF